MYDRRMINVFPNRRAPKRKSRFVVKIFALLLLLLIAGGAYAVYSHYRSKPTTTRDAATTSTHRCAGVNGKLVVVSISARYLWACDDTNQVYDSPVVTGMQSMAADLTPLGTYTIYAKQTDQTLTGSDSTGSWNDFVHYWEPFLSNQYGIYGFHDATWRKDSEFGSVDPYSMEGSHGCVELPLAAAKWIYDWSTVGTTVSVIN